jgi:hypothetical protein
MRIELPLSEPRIADRSRMRPPAADNDDDPFDPPPARALRAAVLPDMTTVVAGAADGMLQAA